MSKMRFDVSPTRQGDTFGSPRLAKRNLGFVVHNKDEKKVFRFYVSLAGSKQPRMEKG
jgi:hypothetical protein